MAHFAEIGTNNQVIRVIVVNNDVLLDENGVEQEQLGKDFCTSLLGGNWVQTSYNGNFRKKYAAALYDPIADVFYDSQPYLSWTLTETSEKFTLGFNFPKLTFFYLDFRLSLWIDLEESILKLALLSDMNLFLSNPTLSIYFLLRGIFELLNEKEEYEFSSSIWSSDS